MALEYDASESRARGSKSPTGCWSSQRPMVCTATGLSSTCICQPRQNVASLRWRTEEGSSTQRRSPAPFGTGCGLLAVTM